MQNPHFLQPNDSPSSASTRLVPLTDANASDIAAYLEDALRHTFGTT